MGVNKSKFAKRHYDAVRSGIITMGSLKYKAKIYGESQITGLVELSYILDKVIIVLEN